MKKFILMSFFSATVLFIPNILKAPLESNNIAPVNECLESSTLSKKNLTEMINTQKICFICNNFLFQTPLHEIQYLVILKCKHFFHINCLHRYFEEKIKVLKEAYIKCPKHDCYCLINPSPDSEEINKTIIDFAILDLSVLYIS